MTKRNRLWMVFGIAAFSLVLLCTGCGKKGDPRYPHDSYPEKVSNLEVSIDGEGAALEWSVPGQWDRAGHVRIFRSALKVEGSDCLNCPRIYAIVEYLPLRNARSKEEGRFRYVDRNIRKGFSYSYRLVICNSSGTCGEESNTVEMAIP
ncbi:MAG: hypothetical protein E4H15_04800 [Syntrophobacterales bacterium]|nr:MAG: hypothetical protein E4H15_04800 [Syntrophobacterales bacterium]